MEKKVRRLKKSSGERGNLSVGGSGKTPFLLMLGKLLQDEVLPSISSPVDTVRNDSRIRLVDEKGSANSMAMNRCCLRRNFTFPSLSARTAYKPVDTPTHVLRSEACSRHMVASAR